MAENDTTDLDNNIVKTVIELRREYGACTARLVATRMQLNRELIRSRIGALQAAGKLMWSEVPGSLRPVPKPRKQS